MFFARDYELDLLNYKLSSISETIIVYGKRRVGKTTLIKEAIKNKENSIYFECFKDTIEFNISMLIKVLEHNNINIPSFVKFSSFVDVFEFLNSLNKKINIVFDEFPYLYELNNPKIIESQFQNIVDNHLSNINIILSGSHIKMMLDLLTEGNPLFGRFKTVINLKEFNYVDASYYYKELTPYEKIAFYSIFGGSPFINGFINPKKSLKENIIDLYLNPTNSIFNYADNLLLSDASNELQAKKILSILNNSKKRYSELEALLDKEKTGKINRALKSLVDLSLIKKVSPINKINDSKKAYYIVNDNVLRFYYTYIFQNKSILEAIGANAFYNEFIEKSLNTYISYRFEEIARSYFEINVKLGKINGIKNIGTYYYDDKKNKTNGEFDVCLELENGYAIYEVKYLKNNITNDIIKKEVSQIELIKELNISKIGFISATSFDKKDCEYDYIDGVSLYNNLQII